jgi:hypothetical protein
MCCLILRFFWEKITVFYTVIFGWLENAMVIMRFGVEVFGNLKTVCCLILRFFEEIITVFYAVILGWLGRCRSDYEVWG